MIIDTTELDGYLQAVLDAGVPGVVALSAGPDGRREQAAGVADVRTQARMTTASRFPIASVTKTFVATVVLQLVAEGALDLDGRAPGLDATVRQLLNHTSGLADAYTMQELIELRPDRTPRALAAITLGKPRLFPPGEGWSYSGSNYVMLGLLVEDVTGSSVRQALAERIFEPLGLTASDLPDALPNEIARGYLPPDNPVVPGTGPGLVDVTDIGATKYAGGGMVSTADEVARFLRALMRGELLPPALQAELLRTVASDWDESDAYGLGIEEITAIAAVGSPCGRAWGHLGFDLGHTTIALSSESGDRQAVVLFAMHPITQETWDTMARLAWACYCGLSPETRPAPGDRPPSQA
ncbi:MAG TPA: serine hydrolase domain-containing protein [Gaiellaceae bacterium]|nr:serine hydrolase domain-containing protein [Gaiellaceae bacterium]